MPKLKSLSGKDIIRILKQFGFEVISQKGSHIKLRRINSHGIKESLTIPNHSELDKGTLKAIIRQAGKYIATESLFSHFYFR